MNDKLVAFDRLLTIMDELREQCPWDKKQTMESLRHLTIEETYELTDAILENDLEEVKKELGDVMLHLVFYAKIASETNTFDIADVIKKHGIENSQVMDIASWMTDVYGQRLTGSTGLAKAAEWAKAELTKMGMKNSELQEWQGFGRGWDMTHFEMHAEAPTYWPIIAYPKAWSAPTSGSGEVIYLKNGAS